jgi:hypothetical protein
MGVFSLAMPEKTAPIRRDQGPQQWPHSEQIGSFDRGASLTIAYRETGT